ncbi:electron transport complex subunit RsxB [Rhodoferax sp. U2-2l]|uniref:electron transport complex subunit RsxB n=1 Tax=Rhodoferax sp. U2-2l TaxID=2884000 RepID=UPI001D0A895F|nr:electron transport complex subunit RsxB [Rhodoferax sp. U2-2l]MCB8748667.1 electron transport complex subunit RsxB [Rhodoferax sp. U2-2l]
MTGLAERLLAALPHTQCTRCGYPDCAAYAHAITQGDADINQCPPGGAEGVRRLAALTGQSVKPLNPDNGLEAPRSMMWIDEDWCIGCTLCIKACPVDAIVGANKLMHTVLETYCTGCALCLPVCPVDCIQVENATGTATGWAAWSAAAADQARDRYAFHNNRVQRNEQENNTKLETKAPVEPADLAHHTQHTDAGVLDKKRAVIEAALARARAKRTHQAADMDAGLNPASLP